MKRATIEDAWPLFWPAGQPRTEPPKRRRANFKGTIASARDEALGELRRLGARYVVLSSNLPVRRDGLFYADNSAPEPKDPGVAAYFDLGDVQHVIACDHWDRVRDNVKAIAKTIEALRGIERWGSTEIMRRAFSAFKALPAGDELRRPWWEVLGVAPGARLDSARAAFRRLAHEHHPDVGGSHERMAELTAAFAEAEKACPP